MARKKARYRKRILRRYDQESLDEPYRRPSTRPDFNFFRELPCELFNEICSYVLTSDTRVDPQTTKPPGFIYTCRYVWLHAFKFYYGSNHFVITVDDNSIDATTLYINTILSKLNDPERRAIVPVRTFAGRAANKFGSLHLIMQYPEYMYNSNSLAALNRVWRHSDYTKHNSLTVFSKMLERMLDGSQTPRNSRVEDDFVMARRAEQEQMRRDDIDVKKKEEEYQRLVEFCEEQEQEKQRQLCLATECPCVLDGSKKCKNRPRRLKGLHDKIYVTSSESSEADSD